MGTFRERLSNAYGTGKLLIGAAHIGRRATGAMLVPGSNQQPMFGGATEATIATGTMLISDPVDRDLPSLADVAVSIYLSKTIPASFQPTGCYTNQTNYISPLGNFSAKDAMPVGKIGDD